MMSIYSTCFPESGHYYNLEYHKHTQRAARNSREERLWGGGGATSGHHLTTLLPTYLGR